MGLDVATGWGVTVATSGVLPKMRGRVAVAARGGINDVGGVTGTQAVIRNQTDKTESIPRLGLKRL